LMKLYENLKNLDTKPSVPIIGKKATGHH
jgi:hypothetical protein